MALWAQAQGAYRKVLNSSLATAWRRWGKFAWTIPFAAADIGVSEDKYAAVGANVADLGVAWALRNQRGISPFILPVAAYAVTRAAISLTTGKGEIRGGTTTQKIAGSIVTVGESNKPFNPIKGHDAGRWGRETTFAGGDFTPGSSWDGNKDDSSGLIAIGIGTGLGITVGLGATRNFWGYQGGSLNFDPVKYPRLARLREIGSKYGFKVVGKDIPDGFLYSELDIVKSFKGLKNYKGVVYNFGLPEGKGIAPPANVINFGHWNLGIDKWKTQEYFAQRFPMAMPETITPYDIFATESEFDDAIRASFDKRSKFIPHAARGRIWRNPTMRRLAKQWGGYGNIIVKDVWAAVQEGVWIGAPNVPNETLKNMLISPERFVLQRKLPFTQEFRTVTVGGKNIYAAHRWGGRAGQGILNFLEEYTPTIAEKIKKSRIFENTLPVIQAETLKGLTGFSEKLASVLPKGIDIAAFDIGMTAQGEFKLIEMQRMFGTIKHPLVNKRILEAVTGRVPLLSKGIIGATAIIGALALPAIMGLNKPIIPIKGHDSDRWGREQTFAGGDFIPGSSWGGVLWSKIRGSFRALRHPVKSVQAWRLGRRLAIGAKGYESMARYALNKQGIVSAGIETEIMTQVAKGAPVKGMIRLRAVGAEGETLISSMRAFGKEEIGLTDIVISESMRGKGVGSFLRRGESAIFKTMGYREGTVVTSPVINPITARIHLQTYGGRLETAFPGAPANLEAQILAKNISKAQYEDLVGMATAVGRLPSNKALVKILGHDMRWGRSWVQRTLKTDFMPGASWVGTALAKGVSFEKIAEAAFKMGGSKVVGATVKSPKVFAKMLKTAHGAGGAEAVKKLIGSEFKVVAEGGGTYLRGATIGKGGFKQTQTVYGISPGTAERGVLAEVYAGGYGTDISRSADKVFGSLSVMTTNAEKFSAGVEGTVTTVHEAYLGGKKAIKSAHPFAYEIKMQREARKAFGVSVPEILDVTKKGFIQEFAGVGLPKKYTTSGLKFAKDYLDKVALHSGVVPLHFDLHRANILRHGAQLRLIDWGLAAKTAVTPKIMEHSKVAADIYFRGMTPGPTQALKAAKATAPTVAEKLKPPVVNDQTAVAAKQMSTKRRERLNQLQQAAQPLPLELNAKRRMSHGVDRSSRAKTIK